MRKYLFYFILLLTAPAFFFTSCGEDRSGEYYALIATKTWIYETMLQNYLFYQDIPAEDQLDFFKKPQAFLESAMSDKDRKNGVNFSHIDSVKTARTTSQYPTFGFEGALVRNAKGDYGVHVLYTYPESPATEMGLKRGDWILSVDSQKINSTNFTEYFERPTGIHQYQVATRTEEGKHDTVEIITPAPRIVEEPSVYLTKTIKTKGRSAYYIMYNSFEPLEENELKAAFARVPSDAKDIILDLRYNPGGNVSTSVLLGALLAPSEAMGQTFVNLVFNDKINRTDSYPLDPALLQGTPKPSYERLFIITTANTASASEIVINCLQPYMGKKLLQVGEPTFGKNVAQSLFTNAANPELELWLTTAYVSNSQGSYDYYKSGLLPDFELEEDLTGELGELGTAQDSLFRPVLYHLEHGEFPRTEQPDQPIQPDKNLFSRWLRHSGKAEVVYNPIARKTKRAQITER